MSSLLKLGTRGSRLALYQAHQVKGLLEAQGLTVDVQIISTRGDRLRDLRFQDHLEKGFFTSELEAQLHDGSVDIVVHSLKDLPTEPVDGLTIAAYPPRADVGDVLLVRPDALSSDGQSLKSGATIGTSAARRQALLSLFAPQAIAVDYRGNVPTRIEKCLNGAVDAIVLARAGVARLGLNVAPLIAFDLNPKTWISAPGQGCLAVQCRSNDQRILGLLTALNDSHVEAGVLIERGVLNRLEGGCHAACGVHSWRVDNSMYVKAGAVLSEGTSWVVTEQSFPLSDAVSASNQIIDKVVEQLRMGKAETDLDWRKPALPWPILD